MWVISFMWFKQNCKHYERDYDFEKDTCALGHKHHEVFTVHPETKKKYYYSPCREKYCPILQSCKDATDKQ